MNDSEGQRVAAARLTPAGIRAFFSLAKLWRLTADEQRALLAIPSSALRTYRSNPEAATLRPETLERISYILGIYKALQILLPKAEAADAWVRKPNSAPLFGGRSALDRMLSGDVADLAVVRQYLDAQCQ
jgi:hypothetical protein